MDELTVEARTDRLGEVLAFVEARTAHLPPKAAHQISIAVDEVFANIASYAYPPERYPDGPGTATVRVEAAAGGATVEFEDRGIPYDPLKAEDPDITLPAGQRDYGGLGVYMTKKLMDAVEYRREGGANILTIKKTAT